MRGLLLVLLIAFAVYKLVRWWARRQAEQDEAREHSTVWGEGGPPRSEPQPPPAGLPRRVALAVEASLTVGKALELVLAPEGFELRFAETADEVDRELAEARPDVILLDPDLLGGEARGRLARRLKQDGRLQGVAVVLIGETGEELWPLEPRARVPRPFASQDLLDAVLGALEPAPALTPQLSAPCPVCGDGIEGAAERCPACGRAHHPECWKLNDGCGACGPG